jgi:hypothetical protein
MKDYDAILAWREHVHILSADTAFALGETSGIIVAKAKALVGREIDGSTCITS